MYKELSKEKLELLKKELSAKYDEYKALTGLDQPVIDFLEKDGEILTFLNSVYALVDHHVERFLELISELKGK